MTKGKRLGFSIFVAVLTVILIACIACTIGINYIFGSSSSSGSIFGKNIYIMNTADMMPELEKGAAVIAEKNEITVLTEGNVILFKQDKNENVMRIVEVVHNTDSTVYRVSADSKQDEIIDVPKENVIAKCTTESISLGKVIKFFKGITGILVGMIFPCVILLAMLIFKIYSVRKRGNEEEDEMFYVQPEGEDVNNDSSGTSANPLFDPLTGVKPDISFEEKKSSIAENFSMKPAAKRNISDNNNIQSENAVEKFRAAVDEKPSAPVTRRPSLAPEASRNDKNHKMAAIKAALNKKVDADDKIDLEKTAAFKIPAAQEKTGEPKSQPVRQQTVSQPIRKNPVQNKPVKKTVPKKQDNIHSIDDLIKALEEEKKKL